MIREEQLVLRGVKRSGNSSEHLVLVFDARQFKEIIMRLRCRWSMVILWLVFHIPGTSAEVLRLHLNFGPVAVESKPDGDYLTVWGAPDLYLKDNWPAMPYRRVTRMLPFGTRVTSITAVVDDYQQIELLNPLAMGAGVRAVSEPNRVLAYPPFVVDGVYPMQHVDWSVHGGLDPKTMLPTTFLDIRVFPVLYHSGSRLLSANQIDLTIEVAYPQTELPAVVARRDALTPYVIVTADRLVPALTEYLTYKNNSGLPAEVHTLEAIVAQYPGVDEAEKVRHFIRWQVENEGTTFVLLAGDADVLPVRRCLQQDGMNIPAEGYFADLYTGAGDYIDWDHNDDGVYGRYPDDLPAMDLMPDLLVARIPASTLSELETSLTHSRLYEAATHEDDDWFNRMLFAAVDTFNERDHGDTSGIPEGECFAEFLAANTFPSIEVIRLYETDVFPHDDLVEPARVVSWASRGAGFMAFHCHGAPDCLAVVGGCFNHEHAAALTNAEMLPVLFGFACSTAEFDNELPDASEKQREAESMPEHFLLNPTGGALGYVGATRVAYASGFRGAEQNEASGALEYPYYRSYFEGMRTPAMMMAKSQRGYLERCGIADYYDYHTLLEYAQFGDPTVRIGGLSAQPTLTVSSTQLSVLSGDDDECLESGEIHSLTVVALNTGAPATNVTAEVTCSDPDVEIQVATVQYGSVGRCQNVSADQAFQIRIASTATLARTVTLDLTFEDGAAQVGSATIPVYLGEGPALVADYWDVWWDTTSNRNLDPGDTAYLAVFLRNVGCSTALGVDVDFTIDSPYVTDCQSSEGSVDIPAGYGATSPWAGIIFQVLETCPHGTNLPIHITFTADNGGPWELDYLLPVNDRIGPRLWDYQAEPRSAELEQPVHLQAVAYDISTVEALTAIIQAYPIGIPIEVPLCDDGLHDDGLANDGVYGAYFTPRAPVSDYLGHLQAIDGLGNVKLIQEALNFSSIPVRVAEVLYVDHSPDPTSVATISEALTATTVDYFVWDPRFRGQPDDSLFSLYQGKIMLWSFGWNNYPDLDLRAGLFSFVLKGGGLLVSGWDVGRGVHREGADAWLEHCLGVTQLAGDTDSNYVDGLTGDPVFNNFSIRLRRLFEGSLELKPDYVQAIAPAIKAAEFRDVPEAAGAIRKDGSHYRSVFLPFALEGVRETSTLIQLLSRVIPWLGGFQPYPTVTPTAQPTLTPLPTSYPPPTATPSACRTTGVTIQMPAAHYTVGETCYCLATVCNAEGQVLTGYPLFMILEVYGAYYFGPTFTQDLDNYLADYPYFDLGLTSILVVEPFTWPGGAGSAAGIQWIGGLTDPDVTQVIGDLGSFTFGWDD